MERPTCKTCVYFDQDEEIDEGSSQGWCRRYPWTPVAQIGHPTKDGGIHFAVHGQPTEVDDWDWCGEHPDFPAYVASLREPCIFPPDPARDHVPQELSDLTQVIED